MKSQKTVKQEMSQTQLKVDSWQSYSNKGHDGPIKYWTKKPFLDGPMKYTTD